MSNMSYCRFQNTSSDFEECAEVLEELLSGPDNDVSLRSISSDELIAAKRVVETAQRMIVRLVEQLEFNGTWIEGTDPLDYDFSELLTEKNDKAEEWECSQREG